MLPIGNLTVFLSVPPSYQYLHSPFTHSPFTFHLFTNHSFTHSLIHHSLFTIHYSPFTFHLFTHSLIQSFTIHYSHFTYSPIHSFTIAHPPTFLLVFFGKAPFYPKSTRRIIEQHPKESGNEVDKSGQTWSELVKCGQT